MNCDRCNNAATKLVISKWKVGGATVIVEEFACNEHVNDIKKQAKWQSNVIVITKKY